MSSNLDNDPFPVFTPRSSLQQQQQLGRSPVHIANQQNQNNLNNQSSPAMNMYVQSSPYGSRFNGQQNILNLMRSPSTSLGSTAINLRHQLQQQQQLNNDQSSSVTSHRQLIANMVQNLNLNQNINTGIQQQSPLINKLQTPCNTPPPSQSHSLLASSSNTQLSQSTSNSMLPPPTPQLQQQISTSINHQHNIQHTSAHRKLFPNIEHANQIDTGFPHHQQIQQPTSLHHSNILNHRQQDSIEPCRQAPPDLSNIVHLKRSDTYFMSDELRSELIRKNLLTMTVASQDLAIQLPSQVKDYHNLVPLDNQQVNIDHKSRTFSFQTISYKATHIKTNCVYYLKRILGFRYINQRCIDIVEGWKKIQNANICTLRDVFGTKEFNGDHSIVFVYDYYPGLETLQYRLYNNPNINLKGWANPYNLDGTARPFSAGKTINGTRSLGLLPEQSVWDFVIQLTSIIRTIHSANLACRIITPSRLLVDHKSRLRLSGIGIFDVIDAENSINSLAHYQQEDLIEFGRLVLALACNSLIAIQKEHINTSVEIISRSYSADLRNLILHFMTPTSNLNGRIKNINDSTALIGARFYTSLDNAYTRGDVIENDLSKEIENGRLFRLICKMNIVLERQDLIGDLQWTETGDRYMLKLFRDYVFHQVSPNGQPWIDISHIVQCLNKFDAGSNEKICLISPDGQNTMIVSYSQLKKCFEKVFSELQAIINT